LAACGRRCSRAPWLLCATRPTGSVWMCAHEQDKRLYGILPAVCIFCGHHRSDARSEQGLPTPRCQCEGQVTMQISLLSPHTRCAHREIGVTIRIKPTFMSQLARRPEAAGWLHCWHCFHSAYCFKCSCKAPYVRPAPFLCGVRCAVLSVEFSTATSVCVGRRFAHRQITVKQVWIWCASLGPTHQPRL
jgi:hypothetical protein